MNARRLSLYAAGVVLGMMLVACGGAPTAAVTAQPTEALPPAPTEAATEAPASGDWMPVTEEVCQTVKESAEQASGLTFTLVASAPLSISPEAGQACQLTASATGVQFSDPYAALDPIVKGMVGWEEDTSQQAGGPTG